MQTTSYSILHSPASSNVAVVIDFIGYQSARILGSSLRLDGSKHSVIAPEAVSKLMLLSPTHEGGLIAVMELTANGPSILHPNFAIFVSGQLVAIPPKSSPPPSRPRLLFSRPLTPSEFHPHLATVLEQT
jgi:hypothetical protein